MSSVAVSASALILLMLLANVLRLALLIRQLGEGGPGSARRRRNARPEMAIGAGHRLLVDRPRT